MQSALLIFMVAITANANCLVPIFPLIKPIFFKLHLFTYAYCSVLWIVSLSINTSVADTTSDTSINRLLQKR